jgi:hypothetical protein
MATAYSTTQRIRKMNQQEQREFDIRLAFHNGRSVGELIAKGLLESASNPYKSDPEKYKAWNDGFIKGHGV